MVALQSWLIMRTSPEGMRIWTYLPSFAISWPQLPAERIIWEPRPGLISTLWSTVPSGMARSGRLLPGRMSTASPEMTVSPTFMPTAARM